MRFQLLAADPGRIDHSDGLVLVDEDVKHLHWLRGKLGDDLLDAAVITTGPEAYRRPDGIAVILALRSACSAITAWGGARSGSGGSLRRGGRQTAQHLEVAGDQRRPRRERYEHRHALV